MGSGLAWDGVLHSSFLFWSVEPFSQTTSDVLLVTCTQSLMLTILAMSKPAKCAIKDNRIIKIIIQNVHSIVIQ